MICRPAEEGWADEKKTSLQICMFRTGEPGVVEETIRIKEQPESNCLQPFRERYPKQVLYFFKKSWDETSGTNVYMPRSLSDDETKQAGQMSNIYLVV